MFFLWKIILIQFSKHGLSFLYKFIYRISHTVQLNRMQEINLTPYFSHAVSKNIHINKWINEKLCYY